MARLLAALLIFGAGASAQAAVISERPDQIAVTIYHEGAVHTEDLADYFGRNAGLAMISETRSVDLPEGISEIQFRGVAATMVPETADLGGLEDAALERNFDYDLLSPGSLLKRSIGETVHLVRTNAKTGVVTEEAATVMSAPEGAILKIGDRYEAYQCSQMPEKLVFDHVPDGLIDRPTLTVRVMAKRAGRHTLTLRYVATGLNWSANYVARVRPDGNSLALSGWLTLANFSESGFPAAAVDVIAGHVETTGEDSPPTVAAPFFNRLCPFPSSLMERLMRFRGQVQGFEAPAPITDVNAEQVTVTSSRIEARNVGDYKQYPLPQATDMAAMQTKQIQFLDQPAVPFERVYVCQAEDDDYSERGEWQIRPAQTLLRLSNTAERGMGKSLPAGDVMTTVDSDGDPVLADQGSLQDMPVGLPLDIQAGKTVEVLSQVREVEDKTIGTNDNRRRSRVLEVMLDNHKPVTVNFEWHQSLLDTAKVSQETDRHGMKNGDLSWTFQLKPGERKELRYTLDEPY